MKNFKGMDALNVLKKMNREDDNPNHNRNSNDRYSHKENSYSSNKKPNSHNSRPHNNKGGNNSNNRDSKNEHGTVFLHLVKVFNQGSEPKEDISRLVKDELEGFINNYSVFLNPPKGMKYMRYIDNAMKSAEFAEAFIDALKDKDFEVKDIDTTVMIVNRLLINNVYDLKEMKSVYKKLQKKYIKKIAKITDDVNGKLAFNLALAMPKSKCVDDNYDLYVRRFLKALYNSAETIMDKYTKPIGEDDFDFTKVYKFIDKLIDVVAKKRKDEFVISILLEFRSTYSNLDDDAKRLWNRLTNYAANYINDKKEAKAEELLKKYCAMREKNNPNAERRIMILSHLNDEDYATIMKVGEKLIAREDKPYKSLLGWTPSQEQ